MEDKSKHLDSLFQSLHETEKKMSKEEQKQVMIENVINLRQMCDYVVSCSYTDVTLLICMLHDYIKALDEIRTGDIQYQGYYRRVFTDMAERLSKQIEYDYDEAVKKCRKRQEKRGQSGDVGEEGLLLLMKRGMQH